jgi:hypothetical protein
MFDLNWVEDETQLKFRFLYFRKVEKRQKVVAKLSILACDGK